MAYDGKIIFNTKIDNSQVDKDLKQLERKIRQSEESISKNENAKLPLVKQAKEAAAALDEAKAKLEDLKQHSSADDFLRIDGSIKTDELTNATKELKKVNSELDEAKKKLSELEAQRLPLISNGQEYSGKYEEAVRKLTELEAEKKNIDDILSGSIQSNPNEYINAIERQEELSAEIKKQATNVEDIGKQWNLTQDSVEKFDIKITEVSQKIKELSDRHSHLEIKVNAGEELVKQQSQVETLSKQLDSLDDKIGDYDTKIQQATADLASNKMQAAKLETQMNSSGYKMSQVFERVKASAAKFKSQILRVGSSMIMFRLFSAALQGISTYMGKVLKTNSEYTAQLARLKGALLTAFQPIYEVALPALLTVLEVLTAIVRVAANVISALFGKTATESAESAENLYNEADAITAVNTAATKAQKALAGFDEINKLSSQNSGGSDAGTTTTLPNFEDMSIADGMDNILTIVTAIGAALLTWKIASAFTDSLSTVAGLAAAVGGAVVYVESWMDALENGLDWENLTGLIGGAAVVVGGLGLAFGTTAAAVGLVVTGVGAVVLALKDWISTGELSTEASAALAAGFTAIGAAISLLTGSWIPLIIAAVAGVAANWDTVVATWKGAGKWFNEKVVTPIKDYFSGLKSKIKSAFKDALSYVKEKWKPADDWFKEKVTEKIKSKFTSVNKKIKSTFKGALSDVKEKWKGVADWFTETVRTPVENVFSKLSKNLKSTINGIIGFLNGMISGIVSGINTVITAINKISVTIPDWIPEVGGKTIGFNLKTITAPKIPLLAQGAVLPANKPFLAMVGDQKHGTNVEAPLSTIQEAVAIVMEDMIQSNMAGHEATVAVLREILEAILGIQIGDDVIARAVTNYQRKMAVARGG